ncbi:hypothetical protein [Aquibacillus saliphilus]|uniref:hypothetical protein n=1 Tax=Aquibacillus saliphilus TaxID=1909422 RepID=UPI001CF0777F|nr:hypothetical protein [Aquibacillus saliphilus]
MAELQPTYGNFKLRGTVQGLTNSKFSFNDDDTKNGFPQHQLKFSIKTSDDNVVKVELRGFKFDKIRIQPIDRDDNRQDEVARGETIPDGWNVFMGVTTGLELDDDGKVKRDKDGKTVSQSMDQYDAAKYIHENLKDGDTVFVGGRNEFSMFDSQQGEKIINCKKSINKIYLSDNSIDVDEEGFEELSSFDQNVIINGVDVDKKEKKAYISAYIIAKDFGEIKTVPETFWINGEEYSSLISKLKKLPFGSQIKVSGNIHSRPVYQDVQVDVDDGWGEKPVGFQPQQNQKSVSGVDKSFEITRGYPETIEERKYSQKDLFPPEEKNGNQDEGNPFKQQEDNNDDWGKSPNSDDSNIDPFAESDDF